jgi:hypothetical protein
MTATLESLHHVLLDDIFGRKNFIGFFFGYYQLSLGQVKPHKYIFCNFPNPSRSTFSMVARNFAPSPWSLASEWIILKTVSDFFQRLPNYYLILNVIILNHFQNRPKNY